MTQIDDLRLVIGTQAFSGWTAIRVSRGMERCPNDFSITMTDLAPEDADLVAVLPGAPCQVFLGETLVVTGYIDRRRDSIDGHQRAISVIGRGKCQDLVDCAAEWDGGQFSNVTVAAIATGLAKAYGIEVKALDNPTDIVPQFNLMLGETAFEIIERVCRFQALLPYESPEGNLTLARVGTKKHASGLHQGVNVESASFENSVDHRFSQYQAYHLTFNNFKELGDGGNLISTVEDPLIDRNRKKIIVQENGDAGAAVAMRRASWEASRRLGRGYMVSVTTDSWRDASGALYEPNRLIEVYLPSLGILTAATWIVSEVTYRRDGQGTHCDLVIMPPSAFQPEPILLVPVLAELSQKH